MEAKNQSKHSTSKEIVDGCRIWTCAGEPNRFQVYRLNHSAKPSFSWLHQFTLYLVTHTCSWLSQTGLCSFSSLDSPFIQPTTSFSTLVSLPFGFWAIGTSIVSLGKLWTPCVDSFVLYRVDAHSSRRCNMRTISIEEIHQLELLGHVLSCVSFALLLPVVITKLIFKRKFPAYINLCFCVCSIMVSFAEMLPLFTYVPDNYALCQIQGTSPPPHNLPGCDGICAALDNLLILVPALLIHFFGVGLIFWWFCMGKQSKIPNFWRGGRNRYVIWKLPYNNPSIHPSILSFIQLLICTWWWWKLLRILNALVPFILAFPGCALPSWHLYL